MSSKDNSSFSVERRRILKAGAATAIGSAGLSAASSTLGQQAGASQAQGGAGPAINTGTNVGRPFRGFVKNVDTGVSSVEDLTLLPIQPRQVLIRVEATAPCYSNAAQSIGLTPSPPPGVEFAASTSSSIPNHAGVGIVEEVGPQVRRVRPGDRVVFAVTSQCGQCYHCLQGNANYCDFTFGADVYPPFAELSDGTPVSADAGLGGFSELAVLNEEYCCPVFTDVPPAELSLLGDLLGAGVAACMSLAQVKPGGDLVVFGAGVVGLGAVQGAKIMSANQVIVIEPIQYRREMALQLGATTVLDPNELGDDLVAAVRDLCVDPTGNRRFAGGVGPNTTTWADISHGADYVICAAGMDMSPPSPSVEPSPDPTGILPMQQALECTRRGGDCMWMGLYNGEVTLPATRLALTGWTIHPGNVGGMHVMRDMPKLVRLIEQGSLDAQSVLQGIYSLDETEQANREIADRTQIANAIVFN